MVQIIIALPNIVWNFLVIAKCHVNISYYYYYYYIMCNTKIKYNQGLGNPGFSSKSSTNAQWKPRHAVPNWDMRMGTTVSGGPGDGRGCGKGGGGCLGCSLEIGAQRARPRLR